ncbi:hypothetical protein FJW07_29760 [Mesorhizobium sp. B3-1-9]|uniref:DUF6916 family protein n=1 Tax=unclassified Mesorhizobium TaxID=325217 RepID=UPI00112A2160|nr:MULTISPECIES: hypothetical protein [unclassified Mesorhizobium]TPI29980.1 hypothetical protein FJW07_29760 [Mesorhizobium sp. B3-1-9]TPI38400.1 hypothetical protein FJ414_12515 [Mesorhizobium sp. B3-1-6]TPI51523.1 hypothetical protein FJ417_28195 [Mesorhizobium sp. B3-1-7]TPI63037.1 hypothetical protein FJ424_20320 [Mesorhizobium sp. B3-1-8]TPI72000.1 hypothetical protein FJ420_13140 [Mesorhizobium sp. B3-1-3]
MASATQFEQAVGQTFVVEAGGQMVALELASVKRVANSPRAGGGFSALFKGPREMLLPQATYRFVGSEITHDIFIVPISGDQAGYIYEAVFN